MDLCYTPARRLARLIRRRELSAREVVLAFIERIERMNPKLNAIVTFLPEQALAQARALDRRKPHPGLLAGLPIAIKDVIATKGVRTTFGSLVHKDHVPGEDHLLAERLKAAERPYLDLGLKVQEGRVVLQLRNTGRTMAPEW